MADPYWGASPSRAGGGYSSTVRCRVTSASDWRERSESDGLSATRWDFAEQLGLRFHLLAKPGDR